MQQNMQPDYPHEEQLPKMLAREQRERAYQQQQPQYNGGGYDEKPRDYSQWIWQAIYWTYLLVITLMSLIYLRDMLDSKTAAWYTSLLWVKDAVILLGVMAYIDKWRQRK